MMLSKKYLKTIFFILFFWSSLQSLFAQATIEKQGVTYDFTFAELAIKYLETGDTVYLNIIASEKAAKHIINHAHWTMNVPESTDLEFIKNILAKVSSKNIDLTALKNNLKFAKDSVASVDLPQQICLQYLPAGFKFNSNLFFTVGYDLGVVYENNSSLNLAHKHYFQTQNEIKYYAIHELHHAGFLILKGSKMPSLNIKTYKEMVELIEYFTQLEGMAVYAAKEIRTKEKALFNDNDYIALMDTEKMKVYEKEYFEILNYFKSSPNNEVTNQDWEKFSRLSNNDRLWYRVGSLMAESIDLYYGREKLTCLISQPSSSFINTYIELKNKKEKSNTIHYEDNNN